MIRLCPCSHSNDVQIRMFRVLQPQISFHVIDPRAIGQWWDREVCLEGHLGPARFAGQWHRLGAQNQSNCHLLRRSKCLCLDQTGE